MTQDRSDELRAAVLKARQYGWARMLMYANNLIDNNDAVLAKAVVLDVARAIDPTVST